MPEPVFMKRGMYIMAPELISTAYYINSSRQFVCVCVYIYSTTFARKRLLEKVTATANTNTTIGELLDASYSMLSVTYQRKVGD
jgi:hypothetical protein